MKRAAIFDLDGLLIDSKAEFQQMTAAVLKSLDDVQAWLAQPAR